LHGLEVRASCGSAASGLLAERSFTMASNDAGVGGDVGSIAVRALAERIATLARTRLTELVSVTTSLLDNDDGDPLSADVKHALAAYASRFFEGFEDDVVAQILDHIRVSRLEAG
jgi:hypothetical protein